MITDRGAGEALSPEDLPDRLFNDGGHLHLSGYTLSGGSRRESALLGGAEDPDRVAQELLHHYPGVVLKLGAGGALYASADGERVRLPAIPVRVVDTTGAGDALSAGFLAGRLSGAPPDRALQQGLELAARDVEQVGARPKI